MRSILFRIPVACVAVSVVFAAPAAADEGGFLQELQERYTSLTPQQLMSEGRAVCSAISNGTNSTAALQMVQKDLGVSVAAAGDIVSAAAGNGQNAPVLTPYDTNLQVVVLDGSLNYVQGAVVTFTTPTTGASGTFAIVNSRSLSVRSSSPMTQLLAAFGYPPAATFSK